MTTGNASEGYSGWTRTKLALNPLNSEEIEYRSYFLKYEKVVRSSHLGIKLPGTHVNSLRLNSLESRKLSPIFYILANI